ncbi:MAG: hypothetical protein EA369_10095 [Bradymonadales bacterium]|nr:MAG: hypothetical protein EA369_10095 [Bradymonadales bacterium]
MSKDQHHHHILANSTSLKVLLFLFVFTFLTVFIARFDFGALNFPIAMLIASAKAMAVMLYFMGLKYDDNQNRAIFFSGFAFFGLFVFFVAVDFFARPSSQMPPRGQSFFAEVTGGPSFERPWEVSEEILAYGREVYFDQACHTCHGDEGFGDGIAGIAIGARSFHDGEGWKNGRRPSDVYKTLMEGLGAMPAYPTISVAARWAVSHFVLDFGPEPPADDAESLARFGIDPSLADGGLGSGEEERATIPVDFAIERYILR